MIRRISLSQNRTVFPTLWRYTGAVQWNTVRCVGISTCQWCNSVFSSYCYSPAIIFDHLIRYFCHWWAIVKNQPVCERLGSSPKASSHLNRWPLKIICLWYCCWIVWSSSYRSSCEGRCRSWAKSTTALSRSDRILAYCRVWY